MRVALLAHQYFLPSGVGTYTRELVRHLVALGLEAELLILYPGPGRPDGIRTGARRVTAYRLPDRRLLFPIWHVAGAPALDALVPPFDLVHALVPGVRVPTRRTLVTTVHDLAPRRLPWSYSLRARWFMRRALADVKRRRGRIVAVSEAVRTDVIDLLGLPPDRVTTTRLGVDTVRYRRVEDPDRIAVIRRRYRLPPRFFLFVGVISPRKNLATLLDGYDRFVAAVTGAPSLVLAGPGRPGGDPAFARRWRQSPNRARIHVTPFIEDQDLPALYSAADALVYPSLHEGFGLPLLEAMACGLPVLCAATTALPEVGGNAALYVSGRDPGELADALARIHGDLALRERLVAAGLDRVTRFSWRRCAEETYAVYQTALAEATPPRRTRAPVGRARIADDA